MMKPNEPKSPSARAFLAKSRTQQRLHKINLGIDRNKKEKSKAHHHYHASLASSSHHHHHQAYSLVNGEFYQRRRHRRRRKNDNKSNGFKEEFMYDDDNRKSKYLLHDVMLACNNLTDLQLGRLEIPEFKHDDNFNNNSRDEQNKAASMTEEKEKNGLDKSDNEKDDDDDDNDDPLESLRKKFAKISNLNNGNGGEDDLDAGIDKNGMFNWPHDNDDYDSFTSSEEGKHNPNLGPVPEFDAPSDFGSDISTLSITETKSIMDDNNFISYDIDGENNEESLLLSFSEKNNNNEKFSSSGRAGVREAVLNQKKKEEKKRRDYKNNVFYNDGRFFKDEDHGLILFEDCEEFADPSNTYTSGPKIVGGTAGGVPPRVLAWVPGSGIVSRLVGGGGSGTADNSGTLDNSRHTFRTISSKGGGGTMNGISMDNNNPKFPDYVSPPIPPSTAAVDKNKEKEKSNPDVFDARCHPIGEIVVDPSSKSGEIPELRALTPIQNEIPEKSVGMARIRRLKKLRNEKSMSNLVLLQDTTI